MNNLVLLNKDFLKSLDEWSEREVYIKLISLNFDEHPRAEITGYATGGSVKVDGASSVRRICSVNMVAENARINELDWAFESKFKLEIGLRNFVNKQYDDIIWFPQGTYIITSFSSSKNAQGYSISIQGKDKMCMLDGSIGGNIFASHDFGKLELVHDDGTREFEDILIYDIIKNAIHEYAYEPYENIIINDLEDCSVELLSYRSKNKNLIIYNSYRIDDESGVASGNMAFEGNSIYDLLANKLPGEYVIEDNMKYELVKLVEYGDTIGYRLTDLTYAGDLILGAGSTITQMLDSIVKLLGEFEYFYDLQGRFVFQRKKIYYNVSWTNAITTERETYYDSIENGSENAYEFTKGVLIESYSNKPDLSNIKNDFTIWGKRKGTSGQELSIHLRCAIDDKPLYYRPIINGRNGQEVWATVQGLFEDEYGNELSAEVVCDWRELIYQMALDYMNSDAEIAKYTKLISAINGDTITTIENDKEVTYTLQELQDNLAMWKNTWNSNYVAYYTDLLEFWPRLYNRKENWGDNRYWNPNYIVCYPAWEYYEAPGQGHYYYDEDTGDWEYSSEKGTHERKLDHEELHIINHETFDFWFDFLEDSYLEKYKTASIGRRTKVVNDTEVKSIFFEETPGVLFIDPNNPNHQSDTSLSYVRLNLTDGMQNYIAISTQGKSAKEVLDSLVYQHTYYGETITLNCVPIYYLEPNVRISVYDHEAGINGEYIIKSFNIPLAFNGSMSITASKAEDLIL